MTLYEACRIASDCGLSTLEEAVRNIQIHRDMLFPYDVIDMELSQLYEEYHQQPHDRTISDYLDSVREE